MAQESMELTGLISGLIRSGFACSIVRHGNGLLEQIAAQSPDLILAEMDGHLANSRIQELVKSMKQKKRTPVMALVPGEMLDSIDGQLNIADDFLASPYDDRELVLRIKRLLNHKAEGAASTELIKSDGLVIDLAKCGVTVGSKVVQLTFKEYELLKFLASNRGRVYTREALLNKVWGYDYYGGDRTVDVHVRRLRSKIEDSKHTYIETVRNIGYRFIKEA
ncbi:MAG TPA: response regulator transcription factor [Dehalococcoidia bacterium]|nr:response regulator transcription factor [Dehalococcoidia bacterium]